MAFEKTSPSELTINLNEDLKVRQDSTLSLRVDLTTRLPAFKKPLLKYQTKTPHCVKRSEL